MHEENEKFNKEIETTKNKTQKPHNQTNARAK